MSRHQTRRGSHEAVPGVRSAQYALTGLSFGRSAWHPFNQFRDRYECTQWKPQAPFEVEHAPDPVVDLAIHPDDLG